MKTSGKGCLSGVCNARIAVVISGGFLVHLALGAMYTFGNFAPYFISYLRNRTDDTEVRNVDGLWINAVGSVGNCLGLSIGGLFAYRFGARIATFIGSAVFCGSVALNYFSVQRSFVSLIFTYGLLGFLGHKLTYGTPIQTAIKWMPEHATLAAGLIVCGVGGGSLIFNQIITGYINPDNHSPDLITEKGERYFTQPEILDRVPTCFLILGAIYFGMMLIGIACISEPPTRNAQKKIDGEVTELSADKINTVSDIHEENDIANGGNTVIITETDTNDKCKDKEEDNETKKNIERNKKIRDSIDKENGDVKINESIHYQNEDINQELHVPIGSAENKNDNSTNFMNGYVNTGFIETEEVSKINGSARQDSTKRKDGEELDVDSRSDLTIRQAIKVALTSRCFYIIWLNMMLINAGMQFITGLYKAYGQTFIEDDHFLALVGSIAAVFNSTGRPVWGAIMDRFGFRVAIRCVSVGFVALVATLLFTEHIHKAFFMVWICGIYFFFCGIWSLMPSALAKLLGPQNMSINYGLIYTGVSVASIIASVAGTSLKSIIGWHGLFYMSAGMGAVVFLLSFLFNGIDREGNRI